MKIANSIFDSPKVGAINDLISLPLPVKDAYALMKFAKELSEKETIYRDAKMKIFKEYGEEKKGILSIKKENEEKAFEELKALAEIEEEYTLPNKIKLPVDIKLSAQQLSLLEDFTEVA